MITNFFIRKMFSKLMSMMLFLMLFISAAQGKNFDYSVPKKIEAKFEYIKTETEKVAEPEIKQSFNSIYDHYLNIKANLNADNISILIGELTFFIKKVSSQFKKISASRAPLLTQLDSLVLHLQYQRDVEKIEGKLKTTKKEGPRKDFTLSIPLQNNNLNLGKEISFKKIENKNIEKEASHFIAQDFVIKDLPIEENIQVVSLQQSSTVKGDDRINNKIKNKSRFSFAQERAENYNIKNKKSFKRNQSTYSQYFSKTMFYLRKQNPFVLIVTAVVFAMTSLLGITLSLYFLLQKIFGKKDLSGKFNLSPAHSETGLLDLYPVFHFNQVGELIAANQKSYLLAQKYLNIKNVGLPEIHKAFSSIILNLNANKDNAQKSHVVINEEKYFIQKESHQLNSTIGFIPYREIRDDRFDYFNMKDVSGDLRNAVSEEVWKTAQKTKMTDLNFHFSKTLMGLSMVFKMKNILVDLDFNTVKDQKIFCPLSHQELDAIFVPFLIGIGQVMENQNKKITKSAENNQNQEINIGIEQRDQRLYINFQLLGVDLNHSTFDEVITVGKNHKTTFNKILTDMEKVNRKVGLRFSLFSSAIKKSLYVNQPGTNMVLTLDLRSYQDIQDKNSKHELAYQQNTSGQPNQLAKAKGKEKSELPNRLFSQKDFRF